MDQISQVAELRQRIEVEYIAAQRALQAPAMVGKHAFITARMERIQHSHAKLRTLVGEAEATYLLAATLDNIQEVRTEPGEPL